MSTHTETSQSGVLDILKLLLAAGALVGGLYGYYFYENDIALPLRVLMVLGGTAAGIAGGTTSIIDFVTPERGEPMLDALAERQAAAAKAVSDYGLHMSVTSWGEDSAAGMQHCVSEAGITSFKTFMAYKESIGVG